MTKTFKIKLDTELTIDFTSWGLSDAEQRGGNETRRLIINHFLEQRGMDEFEIAEKNSSTLSEAMADVMKAQKDYILTHRKDFEINNIETSADCRMLTADC